MRGFQRIAKGPEVTLFATVDKVSWWGSITMVVYRPAGSEFWRNILNGEYLRGLDRIEEAARAYELLTTS